MYKNYFYLVRCAYELNELLNNKIIHDIFSQEKNVLFLNISDEENPNQHIVISTDQNLSYILIKQNHNKAKKNLIDLFAELLPATIQSVSIASDDRIVKVNTNKFNLYFVVRGNSTNIFIEDKNKKLLPFTKSKFDFTKVLHKIDFYNKLEFDFSSISRETSIAEISKKHPQVIAAIKSELEIRLDKESSNNIQQCLENITEDIFTQPISVGYSEGDNTPVFIPNNFSRLSILNDIKTFKYFNDALQMYLRLYYTNKKRNGLKNQIEKYLNNELTKLSNKLNKLKVRVEQDSKEDQYKLFANLLQTNRNNIHKGMTGIEVRNYSTNELINIKLDNKLSSNKNIDKYFEKSRDEKINYQKSKELYNFTKIKYDKLLAYKNILDDIDDTKKLEVMHNEIVPSNNKIIKMETGLKFKYWHYLIENKYHVYVGRDSKSNDYLSIKFAKQNDYWFHARGLPGSHVILRVENIKEGIPKDIIKKAASLSAFYSKAKTAGSASVSYTFAKFVHKKKGMAPGKVLLSKEKTLLVKPGIPKNCELVSE